MDGPDAARGAMLNPNPPDPRSPIHHRAPILCVDRILEVGEDHSLCEFDVREGPHVQDGRLWELGLLEGLAQSAAVLQAPRDEPDSLAKGVGMLVGVRKFEVHRQPTVGERVQWRVDLIKRLGPFMLTRGRASCGAELLAEGELKFFWQVAE